MVDNFYTDLEKAQEVEKAVAAHLTKLTNDYSFYWIGDQKENYRKGDVVAVNNTTGEKIFIEVKNDSCIGSTHNVLLEDEVYYKETYTYVPGNINSDYQIYCVVSEDKRKMWFFDFKVLKENYKRGEFKIIKHPQQITFAYLLPTWLIKKLNGIIATVEF